ncbi:MAG: PrsW family intramembrane metalloprotease [bacterium]|nr:PrsW family intramembrane metalloprotease [bacterium]
MTLGLIALGIIPSIVWLSIYLREDDRPEPNRFILKIFFLGALMAPIAAGVEFLLIGSLKNFSFSPLLTNFLIFFVFVGIVEELAKFMAVKLGIERNSVFDEPADAMIYLIVSGLGFAALENILALFNFTDISRGVIAGEAFQIAGLRFISSTLLHVLASGIVGYSLAQKHFFLKKYSVLKGIIIAGFLHGTYNTLTLASDSFRKIIPTIIVISLLGIMAILVNSLFYKLKKDFYR